MNVLVACEYSGMVRNAFRARGHQAFSCDLIPADNHPEFHHEGDVRDLLYTGYWDLLIAHPPCTYLCNSGVRWLTTIPEHETPGILYGAERWEGVEQGARLFIDLLTCGIPKIAVENPIMHCYARRLIGELPDQIIQPYEYGHGEIKKTCLWLKGLPLLTPTNIVPGRTASCHHASPGEDRWKLRSITYPGIADAMAAQWG